MCGYRIEMKESPPMRFKAGKLRSGCVSQRACGRRRFILFTLTIIFMSSQVLDQAITNELTDRLKSVLGADVRGDGFQSWLDKRASQIRLGDSSGIGCYLADILVNGADLDSKLRSTAGLVLKHHCQKWYARMNGAARSLLLEMLATGFQLEDLRLLRVVCIIVCTLASDAPPPAAAAPRLDVGIATWAATGVPVIDRYVSAFSSALAAVKGATVAEDGAVARLHLFIRSLSWLFEDAGAGLDEPTASQLTGLVADVLQYADYDRPLIKFRRAGTRRQSLAMAGQPAPIPGAECADGAAPCGTTAVDPAGEAADSAVRDSVTDAAAIATCALLSHPVAFAPGSGLLTALLVEAPAIVGRVVSLLRHSCALSDATRADLLRAAACACISQPVVRVVGGATPLLLGVALDTIASVARDRDAAGAAPAATIAIAQLSHAAAQGGADASPGARASGGALPSIARGGSWSAPRDAGASTAPSMQPRGGAGSALALTQPQAVMAAARLIAVIPTLDEGMAVLARQAEAVAAAVVGALTSLGCDDVAPRTDAAIAARPPPLDLLRYNALRARDAGQSGVEDEELLADREDSVWRVEDELSAGAEVPHWADGAGEGRDTVGKALLRTLATLSGQMAGVYVALVWPGIVSALATYSSRDLLARSRDADAVVSVLTVATGVARAAALIPAFYERDLAPVVNIAGDLIARTGTDYRVTVAAADLIAAAAAGVVRAPLAPTGTLSRRASVAASPGPSPPSSPSARAVDGVRVGGLMHSLLRALSRTQPNEAHVSVCFAVECLLDAASAMCPKGSAADDDVGSPSPSPPMGTLSGALPAVRPGSGGSALPSPNGAPAAATENEEQYVATHKIRELLRGLTSELVAARPADPLRFLREAINTRIEAAHAPALRSVPGAPVAEHILRKIRTIAEAVASSVVGLPTTSGDDADVPTATAARVTLAHCRLVEALADAAREELDSPDVGGKLALRLVDLWATTPLQSPLILPIAASLRSVVQNAPHLIEAHADLIADRCVTGLLETCPDVDDDDDDGIAPESPRSGAAADADAASPLVSTGGDDSVDEVNTHSAPVRGCDMSPLDADRVASCLDLLAGLATQCAEAFPPIAAAHNVIEAVDRATAYASKGLKAKLVPDPSPRRVLQGVLGLVADMIRASPHMMTPVVQHYLRLALFCAPMPNAGLQLNAAYLIGEAATKCPTAFVHQTEFDGPAGAVLVNALERCSDQAAATGIAVALGRVASVTPHAVTSRMHPDAVALWAGLVGQMPDVSEKMEASLGLIRAFSSSPPSQPNRALVPTLVHAVGSFQRPPRAVQAALLHLAKNTPNVQQHVRPLCRTSLPIPCSPRSHQFADVNDEIAATAVRLGIVSLN